MGCSGQSFTVMILSCTLTRCHHCVIDSSGLAGNRITFRVHSEIKVHAYILNHVWFSVFFSSSSTDTIFQIKTEHVWQPLLGVTTIRVRSGILLGNSGKTQSGSLWVPLVEMYSSPAGSTSIWHKPPSVITTAKTCSYPRWIKGPIL